MIKEKQQKSKLKYTGIFHSFLCFLWFTCWCLLFRIFGEIWFYVTNGTINNDDDEWRPWQKKKRFRTFLLEKEGEGMIFWILPRQSFITSYFIVSIIIIIVETYFSLWFYLRILIWDPLQVRDLTVQINLTWTSLVQPSKDPKGAQQAASNK